MKKITFLIACCIMYAGIYAQSWLLTGNSGTNPPTNFIGTTDAKALMLKVNNQRSGYIDFAFAKANTSFGFQALKNPTGNNNAAFGYKASFSNTSGIYNTALGAYALFFNTTGYSNVAAGVGALYKNTDRSNCVAIGDSALYNNGVGASDFEATGNTAVGSKALYLNTTGFYNTATGYNALISNTSGGVNTATGYNALYLNTTGGANTATGVNALFANTSGYSNTATGVSSLYSNTSGAQNTATGNYSLNSNTTGSSNTANGYYSLYSNTTGYHNTANGEHALFLNKTGFFNTASGTYSLYLNNSGSYNTATGNYSLYSNTTGSYNIANGYNALLSNQTGSRNIAVGNSALRNYKYSLNIAIGDSALASNTNGYSDFWGLIDASNIAIGYRALSKTTTGFSNLTIAAYGMPDNTTGYYNVSLGESALSYNTTGSYNTAVGVAALAFAFTKAGQNNTGVGALSWVSNPLGGDYTNTTVLGYAAEGTASNQVRIGNSDVTSIGGYAGWSNISDGRVKKNIKQNVPGIAFINKLKPITYNLDLNAADKILKNDAARTSKLKSQHLLELDAKARKAKEQIVYTGFIAQDVEKVAKELNYDFSGVDAAKNETDLYGLRYAEFVVPLVKAVQELSKMNDDKDVVILNQNNKIDGLEERLTKLEAMLNGRQSTSSQSSANNIQIRTSNFSSAFLEQNIPNPFNHTTTINYTLPQTYSSAKIIITDKSGKSLKEANVSGSGKGSLKVDAFSLSSGAYQYSLYIDGRLIDTKQMVLAK